MNERDFRDDGSACLGAIVTTLLVLAAVGLILVGCALTIM